MLLSLPSVAPAGSRPASTPVAKGTAKLQRSVPSKPGAVPVKSSRTELVCARAAAGSQSAGRPRQRNARPTLVAASQRERSSEGRGDSLVGCRGGRKARPIPPAIEIAEGLLLAIVGPLRIPTRLYVAMPERRDGESIEFNWPVDGAIASGFGRRTGGWHAGIDIRADSGTPILAAAAGTVVFSGWAPFYGRVVKIEHGNGFMTLYAHNHENLVEPGDPVAAGAVIATVGRTGRASAEHLHFEIRRDGMAFNPLHLLEARGGGVMLASAAVGDSEQVLESATDDSGPALEHPAAGTDDSGGHSWDAP
jgi:murein DD-endopeptidase MepM/ murein hydrolase activator NlpD